MDTPTQWENKDVIEVKASPSREELEQHYMDISQVAMFLDVNERSTYRLLATAREKHNIKPKETTYTTSSGKEKKYYFQNHIREVARVLGKDPNAKIPSPDDVQKNRDRISAPGAASPVPILQEELKNTLKNLKGLARVGESFDSLSQEIAQTRNDSKQMAEELIRQIKDLNGNFEKSQSVMNNIVDKVMAQGIDFKEKYLDHKRLQMEIEQKREESIAKVIQSNVQREEALTKLVETNTRQRITSEESLNQLAEKITTQKTVPFENMILTVVTIMLTAGIGLAFLVSHFSRQANAKWEERFAQERNAQQAANTELVAEVKNLKEELSAIPYGTNGPSSYTSYQLSNDAGRFDTEEKTDFTGQEGRDRKVADTWGGR